MKRYLLGWVRRIAIGLEGFKIWLKVGYPFVLLSLVLLLAVWLMGYGWLELIIVFALGMVFIMAEMFNYAIEKLCNIVGGREIKIVKDISAGAVLVSGIVLIAVSLYIIL